MSLLSISENHFLTAVSQLAYCNPFLPERTEFETLNEDETRNSLAIIRAEFAKPEIIQPSAKGPSRSLLLLRHLADFYKPGQPKTGDRLSVRSARPVSSQCPSPHRRPTAEL